ncbi:MAG TPA: zf-HC2 domain-containing protein [Propionibacteriaceae bacterium]|nr:zf-HC2 domain-containing protein [Propionibacteriaceae bacterium]
MKKAPCAELAELRSAYVDGALDEGDRERLLGHLVGCAECRHDVAVLREIRELLTQSRSDAAPTAPDLSLRLLSIAGEAAQQPLWARPFRRTKPVGPISGLPSRRRTRRVRAAAFAMAVGTAVAAVGVVGYTAAPSGRLEVIRDPAGRAQAAFSSSLGQFPLSGDTLGAVMLADAAALTSSPAARGPGPSLALGQALTPDAARRAMQRAAETGDSLSYSGVKSFYGSRGGRTMAAVIQIEARTGQGSEIKVRSRTGQQLLGGFSPASIAAPVVDDELVTLLERNYDLSGIDTAFVAGRRAAVVAASRQGRVAARWWLDDATGLVLWQETYDERGEVELSFGFTSIAVSPSAELLDHLSPRLATASTTTSWTTSHATGLSAAGWSCRPQLAGLSLVRLHSDRAQAPRVLHLVYSDGLNTVGVYEQRGRLDGVPDGLHWEDGLQAYVHHGASGTATWQAGDVVFTVVTDGPADVLRAAVAALPHDDHGQPTTMDRVKEGWVKILADVRG